MRGVEQQLESFRAVARLFANYPIGPVFDGPFAIGPDAVEFGLYSNEFALTCSCTRVGRDSGETHLLTARVARKTFVYFAPYRSDFTEAVVPLRGS